MQSIEGICATEHPPQLIRLVQYRPAWLEQLALRVSGLPHVVVNSSYAVTEGTGPLPFLQDLSADPPAMMGRQNLSFADCDMGTGNAILDYLQTYHDINLDSPLLTSPEQLSEALAYKTLIRQTLVPILAVLQFQDEEAWTQISRPRCLQAGAGVVRGRWFHFSSMQARSERIFELSKLTPDFKALSTETVIRKAKAAYQVFEHALQKSANKDGCPNIMKTLSPTAIDVMLWDHLMHALTDVHLVVILAEFPELVAFVQRTWDDYFGVQMESPKDWELWNARQNELNAFCQVPSLSNKKKGNDSSFRHAFDLMEHLSVREQRLGGSLMVVKEAMSLQRQYAQRASFSPFHTWHRWRVGGPLYPSKNSYRSPGHPDLAGQQEQKTRAEYRKNDELWISAVGVGTALSVLIFGLARPQGQK